MPNPYFKFKQFTIFHDRCAMKVGTDGVLLGAWANINNCRTGLDIGTGSGLIALMLAQRSKDISIEAIDIESSAIEQAMINIKPTNFAQRINCTEISLQNFYLKTKMQYDLIISNPPFFSQSLKSSNAARTAARHTDSLQMGELIKISSTLLSKNGRLSMIYPFDYKAGILDRAKENGLFITRFTNVYPTKMSNPKRILVEISRDESRLVESDLVIETERHKYSDEFTQLVKGFYLNM